MRWGRAPPTPPPRGSGNALPRGPPSSALRYLRMISCSMLPLVLALVMLELVKILTFPHINSNSHATHAPPEAMLRATQYEYPGSRWDLMDCINQNQESYRATTWASAMSPRSAPLLIVAIWWSRKPASIPLTITTQMSAARLWQLKALCMHYRGPVSAVLYVGLLRGRVLREDGLLSFMVRQAESLHRAMEADGRCKLDLMLVREVFDDSEAKIWYPVNQLRNYARLQARTPLMAIVDADLLVSPVLVEELRQAAVQRVYLEQLVERKDKAVYVLPAFQVPSYVPREEAMTLADQAVGLSKDLLRTWFSRDEVVPFDPGKPGHAATNYSRWFSSREAYQVQYALRYEPWVLCDRRSVPWHDNVFKGYGLNKIMHLEHMNWTGYRFLVHPSAFLVHRAHRSTKAKKLVLNAKLAQKSHSAEADEAKEGSWEHKLHEEDVMAEGRRKSGSVAKGNGGGTGRRVLAEDAAQQQQQQQQHGASSTYAYTQSLGEEVRRKIAAGTYEPRTDQALAACLKQLSWWQAP